MLEFLSKLFDTTGFPARWRCGTWTEGHGWLHIASDLAVFGAYAAIPISIALYILVKKQEVTFLRLYWLFAAFILSCGFTHLIDATLFWHPWYRLSGTMKLITAVVSWATVVVLVRTLPMAMRLPGTAKLADRLMQEAEERKRSESALRESSTRLSLALEHSGLGDWSWDARTRMCQLSPRAAEILDLPPGECETSESLLEHIHSEDRIGAREAVRQAIADRSDYDHEYRIMHANGAEVWVSAKGRAEYDEHGDVTGFIGTLADVTERKVLEREREELLIKESAARAGAERANRMKDEFLATLSHELRTPLNAILGWSTMLRTDHADADELKMGLEVIERNTQVQARLIEDLLDMSRIISGKVRLDLQQVDLCSVIEAALDAVRPVAESRKVGLVSVLDPLAGPVRGDPARLQQIVWNLLSNAIKFTPAEGKIDVALERNHSHVEITVSDTGIGIDPEFVPFVFDRFRQGDPSITRKHGGLGLGLSIVKNLTEMHGGFVNANSAGHGRGASFRIALPLPTSHMDPQPATPPGDPTASNAIKSREHNGAALRGSTVLVVDDDPDCIGLVRRMLEKQGAIVVTACSGGAALDALKQQRFHALISDIGMPEMDGLELIQKVRLLQPDEGGLVPAIVLTAFARTDDRRRAMAAGFDTFISKPVDPGELLAAVALLLSRQAGSGNSHHP